MKYIFLFIFVFALYDGYSQENKLIVDFSSGAGFVDWQSFITKDYYQTGDKKSSSDSYLGYNLPIKLGLLIKNNRFSYGFGFSYEQSYLYEYEYKNKYYKSTLTKLFLQGEYQLASIKKYVCGVNLQIGKFFQEDVSSGSYEYFIGTGFIIQYPIKDKYFIYFKPEYELKYYNVDFEAQEPWPSSLRFKINGNQFIHHINANIGFRIKI